MTPPRIPAMAVIAATQTASLGTYVSRLSDSVEPYVAAVSAARLEEDVDRSVRFRKKSRVGTSMKYT
jgi:hypothetical protein